MSRLRGASSHKKKKIGLLISLLIIVIGGVPHVILVFVSDSYNSYTMKPLSLASDDGTYISAWLYTPVGEKNHAGIVVGHHLSGSKLHTHPLSSELAKAGFTVINLDFRGHGASNGIFGRSFIFDMLAAIDYIENDLTYITEIGLVGHSYGARMATKLAKLNPSRINATVSIGNVPTDAIGISNLLVAVSISEPLINEDYLLGILREYTGQENVEFGKQYGNWATGNKIMMVVSSSTHLFEVIDPSIIYHTVQWFEQAFNSKIASDVIVTAPFSQIFSYISWFGIVALVFVVIVYLSDYLFKRKTRYPEREILNDIGEFSISYLVKYYIIYVGLIGGIFLYLWELTKEEVIPSSTVNSKIILLIGNAIGIIFVYTFLIVFRKKRSIKAFPLKIKGMLIVNPRLSLIYGIISSLLIISAMAIGWHWSVNNIQTSAIEIVNILGLTLICFPFFFIKEFYFRNVHGFLKTSKRSIEYFTMVIIGIFMDNFSLFVVVLLKYANLFYMPINSLYVFGLIIFSIIHQVTTTWVYMWSGRNIIGSTTFLTIFFAWMSIIFLPSFGFL